MPPACGEPSIRRVSAQGYTTISPAPDVLDADAYRAFVPLPAKPLVVLGLLTARVYVTLKVGLALVAHLHGRQRYFQHYAQTAGSPNGDAEHGTHSELASSAFAIDPRWPARIAFGLACAVRNGRAYRRGDCSAFVIGDRCCLSPLGGSTHCATLTMTIQAPNRHRRRQYAAISLPHTAIVARHNSAGWPDRIPRQLRSTMTTRHFPWRHDRQIQRWDRITSWRKS